MARPKGATREKTLMRDAYKISLLATAERAKSGDQKSQEQLLDLITNPKAKELYPPLINF